MAKAFRVDIVSPEGLAWSGEAEFVVARTPDGEIGIMADHEPVMAALVQGVVSVDEVGGGRTSIDVDGGFLQVLGSQVTVITDRAKIDDGTAA
jgi:F-type H+-transporting ATPase subunit epsilon